MEPIQDAGTPLADDPAVRPGGPHPAAGQPEAFTPETPTTEAAVPDAAAPAPETPQTAEPPAWAKALVDKVEALEAQNAELQAQLAERPTQAPDIDPKLMTEHTGRFKAVTFRARRAARFTMYFPVEHREIITGSGRVIEPFERPPATFQNYEYTARSKDEADAIRREIERSSVVAAEIYEITDEIRAKVKGAVAQFSRAQALAPRTDVVDAIDLMILFDEEGPSGETRDKILGIEDNKVRIAAIQSWFAEHRFYAFPKLAATRHGGTGTLATA